MKKLIIVLAFSLISLTGCIDIDITAFVNIMLIDLVSVSSSGQIAICDTDVFITDFKGSRCIQVTEDNFENSAVRWSHSGKELLHVENDECMWKLNLFSVETGESYNILRENYKIAVPYFSYDDNYITYLVFSEKDSFCGSINICERDTNSISIIAENAYYDYLCMPGSNKILYIDVISILAEKFEGRVMIRNMIENSEEVIFNGIFAGDKAALDVTPDGRTIIFYSAEEETDAFEIYTYDVESKKLSKWQSPEGYEAYISLADLNGYLLANIKGIENDSKNPLYMISLDKRITEVPGLPLCMKGRNMVCLDMNEDYLFSYNFDTKERINITERIENDIK